MKPLLLDTHIWLWFALESSHLPGEFHADPADRILVATARRLDATLITADRKIIEYGKSGFVRIMEP